jgi:ribosomal protein L16 Arg81 hydroxylase
MVAMIKGAKRYILNPPYECNSLDLIKQQKHPSYRHSMIDWSDIEQAKSKGFDKVDAIETIVQTGEVLYIPSYWFHYIVSLKYSIQCNTRSGSPPNSEGLEDIDQCLGTKPRKW